LGTKFLSENFKYKEEKMKKLLSLLLVGILSLMFVGFNAQPVVADEAATTVEASDYDTTLTELVAVRFDSAFGTEAWGQQYTATAVEATSDGGYIVGGMVVTDGWSLGRGQLVKFDSDFAVEWTLSMEDHQFNYISALLVDSNGDIWVFANDVVVDDNGTPADDTDDITTKPRVLVKLSGTDRSVLDTFVSSADETVDWDTEWESNSIVELSNGNILLASTKAGDLFYEIVNPADMTLVTSGSYGSTGSDKIKDIKVAADPNGGFYLTGGFAAMDGNLAALGLTLEGSMDILVSKFDNAGVVQWTQQLSSTGGWNNAFAVAYYDGYVYIAGEQYGTADGDFTGNTNQGDSDAMIAKLDATDGTITWTKTMGGTGTERFYDLKVTADGIFAGGFSNSKDVDLLFGAGIVDGNFIAKFDLDGNVQGAALHHSRYNDGGNAVRVYALDLLTTGEMVYAASMGYWVNLDGTVDATNNEHKFSNNSYNFDNPLSIGTWGKWAAGSAVVKFGVDTTAPVFEASEYLVVPVGYDGPLYDAVSDDFAHPLRMQPGYTGTVDFNTAGTYTITLTAEDYAGNEGTKSRTIVVYSELNNEMVNSETITSDLPKVVLLKDADYTCEMAGVSVALSNNTLTASCVLPDTSAVGSHDVMYTFANSEYVINLTRELEVVLNVIGVVDAEQVYVEQEVRVPFGYTVTVDTVAVDDGYMITEPGAHVVVINDGTADETINFEILEVAQGVKDGGFYANETTITFDDTAYTATLDGVSFTSGTLLDTWGHYVFELTEIADPLNVITMNFVIGDEMYMDLFEHGVLTGNDYLVDGNLTRINGSENTSDGGYIAVGDRDGAMYVVKFAANGDVEFEHTFDSSGDDTLIDIVEIASGRFAAIGFIAALDNDFATTSLNPYPNGEEAWYNYRVILDIHWDGTDITFDAFNGNSTTEGLVNGNGNYMGQAQIEYDAVDDVLYISHVVDQWSFAGAGGFGSHDVFVGQYTIDADSFDFGWYQIIGSTGWDRVGRMNGYGAPLTVVPGEGVVTGYSAKASDGTALDATLLASATPWYDDGEGGEYESAVIVRIGDDGVTDWVKTMAGNDSIFFIDVEVDAAGNIYVAGSHHTNVEPEIYAPYGDFDETVDNASTDYEGNRDIWVAKLDSMGETLWIQVAGTEGGDELKDIAIDSAGNIIVVGYIDETNIIGGDLYVEARESNTRTLLAKFTADGLLVAFESYNSEEFSLFNSVVILSDDSIVAFGYIKADETYVQSQTDFEITPELDGLTKFVGITASFEFMVDEAAPTVTSVPEIVIEEGIGSLDLLNDITDSIFEKLVFEFADGEDMDYLVSYEVTGTIDFAVPATYTLSFVAYDMRMNASVATDLVVHVVAEASNEDGTVTLDGVDYVVAGMGDANLDLDDDNSAFVADAGTVTIAGETLMKMVYDLNDTMFDVNTPGVYDIIEVFANENYFVLLDRNITLLGGLVGIVEGTTYTEPVTGNFAGTATLNGVAYTSGTEITEAGNHTIELIEYAGATPIVVNFTITSGVNVEDDETYNKTTTPVFRGTATLNGDAFTSGTDITVPGEYTLVITGVGSYSETYEFSITSGVNVDDAEVLDDSFNLVFRGTATLNGDAFTSGTEVNLPGTYVLVISGVGTYTETINFTVESGFTGVEDGDEVDSGTTVTVRFNTGVATISVDGAAATALTSGARLSDDGLYVITITGAGDYEEVVTFRIGEEPITSCPTGQELVDGACQAITCPVGQELDGNDCNDIVCEDGFELDGNDCVEEEKTGCFGTIGFRSGFLFAIAALGGAVVLFIRKKH
jgi:hypothetical protein